MCIRDRVGAGVAILWAVKRTRSRWDVGTMQRATVPIVAASILSVSYTHLDVYKRQAIVIAVAIYSIALHVVPAPYSGVLTACLPLLELPILDVYKRQAYFWSALIATSFRVSLGPGYGRGGHCT